MATPTVPTVPFPTPTDVDTDDDDDDDGVPPQPPAGTPPAAPPPAGSPTPAPGAPPAASSVPGAAPSNSLNGPVPSGSPTPLADNLPSGLSTPTSGANSTSNGGGGLSTGASAGLGVGVAIAVILMIVGAWMFVRRRRRRQQHRKTSTESKSSSVPRDEETGRGVGAAGADVRAYHATGVPELSNNRDVPDVEKARYYNELASPVVPQEVHGDRDFAVELPGSSVPSGSMQKEGEIRSLQPPAYDQHAPPVEKKSGVRLFDDAPLDEGEETLRVHEQPRPLDRKGAM